MAALQTTPQTRDQFRAELNGNWTVPFSENLTLLDGRMEIVARSRATVTSLVVSEWINSQVSRIVRFGNHFRTVTRRIVNNNWWPHSLILRPRVTENSLRVATNDFYIQDCEKLFL